MQDESFAQLAAEAAFGLRGDREIYLEVCARLRLRIPRYNAVNTLNGYGAIAINTPAEVVNYEE